MSTENNRTELQDKEPASPGHMPRPDPKQLTLRRFFPTGKGASGASARGDRDEANDKNNANNSSDDFDSSWSTPSGKRKRKGISNKRNQKRKVKKEKIPFPGFNYDSPRCRSELFDDRVTRWSGNCPQSHRPGART